MGRHSKRRVRDCGAHDGEVELLSIQDGAVRCGCMRTAMAAARTTQALKEIVEGRDLSSTLPMSPTLDH